MALSAASHFASFDVGANTMRLDYSQVMFAALRQDPAILSRIRVGEETSDTTYRWIDDVLNAHQVTLGASLASAATDTAVTLATGHGSRLREGSILVSRLRDAAHPEHMQVTATDTSAVTVTRGYGGTTRASYASTAVFDISGNPLQEGSSPQKDVSTTRTQRTNFTQIFERTVKISRNQMLRLMEAVSSEWDHQVMQRMFETKRELNKAVLYGRSNTAASGGSDAEYRTFDGIDAYLIEAAGNNTTTAATISQANINARSKDVWDDGGDPDLLVVSADLQQTITGFESASIRRLESSRTRGFFVDVLLTDLGVPLEVVLDPYCVYAGGRGDYYVLDSSRLSLHPFRSSAFFLLSNPDNDDGRVGRVLGEWTLRVSNPGEAHARATNVAAS